LINPYGPWKNREHVELDTLDWVHRFNTQRPHESIDDLTPERVEQLHYTHQTVSPRQVDTKRSLRTSPGRLTTMGVARTVVRSGPRLS
jgi:putative transposase